MFSHFLANKRRASADVGLNNYRVSPSNAAAATKQGSFWPTSVWNLWPSALLLQKPSTATRSKYSYKDFGEAERHHEQRQRCPLIALGGPSSVVDEPCPTPPPMSPSMFTIPRHQCFEEQLLYSPVKLAAAPEGRPKRIQFRPDDCVSLIEKFDKITIMDKRGGGQGAVDEGEDKENKMTERRNFNRVGGGRGREGGRKGRKGVIKRSGKGLMGETGRGGGVIMWNLKGLIKKQHLK